MESNGADGEALPSLDALPADSPLRNVIEQYLVLHNCKGSPETTLTVPRIVRENMRVLLDLYNHVEKGAPRRTPHSPIATRTSPTYSTEIFRRQKIEIETNPDAPLDEELHELDKRQNAISVVTVPLDRKISRLSNWETMKAMKKQLGWREILQRMFGVIVDVVLYEGRTGEEIMNGDNTPSRETAGRWKWVNVVMQKLKALQKHTLKDLGECYRSEKASIQQNHETAAMKALAHGHIVAEVRENTVRIFTIGVRERVRGTGVTDVLLARMVQELLHEGRENFRLIDAREECRPLPLKTLKAFLQPLADCHATRDWEHEKREKLLWRIRKGAEKLPSQWPVYREFLRLLAPLPEGDSAFLQSDEGRRRLDGVLCTLGTLVGGWTDADEPLSRNQQLYQNFDHPGNSARTALEKPPIDIAVVSAEDRNSMDFFISRLCKPERMPEDDHGTHWLKATIEGKIVGIVGYDQIECEDVRGFGLRRFHVLREEWYDSEGTAAELTAELLKRLLNAGCIHLWTMHDFYDEGKEPPVLSLFETGAMGAAPAEEDHGLSEVDLLSAKRSFRLPDPIQRLQRMAELKAA